MDKSQRYIELCRKAADVQCRWVQTYGDFYRDDTGRVVCWLAGAGKGLRMKKGFAVCSRNGVIRLSRYVWLPRQNQLIEMAQVKGRTYDSVVLNFFNWTKSGYDRDGRLPGSLFPTMEQIWLAFVMERKFLKKWDGTEWAALSVFGPTG